MEKIAVLDSQTIDRIAAGEVVERPSSVIKELAENAIDAGATVITVEIRGGGKTLIRVTDNGCGIEREMVPLAFERHATSKLRSIEDLTTIETLGFRGEALSSIAAVSKTQIMTKTKEDFSGTMYRIEGGTEKENVQAGLPEGTTILVKDLFYHMPARLKFLKTDQTETAYAADLMEQLSLSHPDIAFRFIADEKTKLQTAGSGNLKDVIYRIYGSAVAKNLIEVDVSDGTYRISGFLGKPSLSRGNRRYESVFVNGRYVRDRILQKGIEDGCKRYLMQHQFPFAVIFFETDGHLVDVNVHPAKAQVRFSDEKAVYDFVRQAVSDALHTQMLIPEVLLDKKEDSAEIFMHGNYAGNSSEAIPVREPAEPYETKRRELLQRSAAQMPVSEMPSAQVHSAEQLSLPIPPTKKLRFRLIGSLFDTYWLLEYDGKLYLADQHAAHERVNYERYLKLFHSGKPDSQQVYPAIPVTLQPHEIELADRYADQIRACGFRIEFFGGSEYRITAVPTALYGMNAEAFFLSFLDEINDLSTGTIDPDTITDRLAASACKASIKGHDVISDAEAVRLLEMLFDCDDPYHCPHGRPALVSMTKGQIEKMFGRVTP